MKKKTQQLAVNIPKPARQPGRKEAAESGTSSDVERVLEHISSPYRWELLEIPPVRKLEG